MVLDEIDSCIKFTTIGMFFNQSPQSHPDNVSHIKTGPHVCKYLRSSYTHFTPEVPI